MRNKIIAMLTILSVVVAGVGCGNEQSAVATTTEQAVAENVNTEETQTNEAVEGNVVVTDSELIEENVDLVLEGERYLFGLDGYEQSFTSARNMFSFAINEDTRKLDATAFLLYMYENDMVPEDKLTENTKKGYIYRLKKENRAEGFYHDAMYSFYDLEKQVELYELMANESELEFFKALSMKILSQIVEDKNEAAEWKAKAEELDINKYFENAGRKTTGLGPVQLRNLASIYRNGNGVEKDIERAFDLYMQAAELGDASSMNTIGYMYEHGEGVEQDYQKAIEYFEKSSKDGDTTAISNLAHMYREGLGVDKDSSKAFELYLEAANRYNDKAMNTVGYMYEHGEGVDKNKEEAALWYIKAMNMGNTKAKDNLAFMNDTSEGHADYWLNKMKEEAGHESFDICIHVAQIYFRGITVAIDYEMANKYFQKALAIDPNCALALEGMGSICFINHDYEMAKKYFQKALAIDPNCINALGCMGTICMSNKDYEMAKKYWQKALDVYPNATSAMVGLGTLWYYELTTGIDDETAISYIKRAYELTHDENIKATFYEILS